MKKISSENRFRETGLSSNMEDYIEAIAMLSSNNRVVRVKDIAKKLKIKMPSVTSALNKLKKLELIEYEKYGFIELTRKGKIIAESVYSKHECLTKFFNLVLMLNDETADSEACKAEHVLLPDTCNRIYQFLSFYNSEKKKNKEWISRLNSFLT